MVISNPRAAINYGFSRDVFTTTTVTSTTYNTDCDVMFNIKAQQGFRLDNYGNVTVTVSFNGETDALELRPSTNSASLQFDFRAVSKIWFKVASGSAVVTAGAWAKP